MQPHFLTKVITASKRKGSNMLTLMLEILIHTEEVELIVLLSDVVSPGTASTHRTEGVHATQRGREQPLSLRPSSQRRQRCGQTTWTIM